MLNTQRNVTLRRFHTLAIVDALFVMTALLLFSTPNVTSQQPRLAYAQDTCVEYDESENTIRVTCDASFRDVANTVNDNPSALEEIEGGNGEYLLNANLEVEDGATFTVGPNDGITWLKIAGENGIIVNGKIEIDGIKITSWDIQNNLPIIQNSVGTVPRAFINLRVSEGGFIRNSEIGYLGYDEPPKRGIDLGESSDGPSHDFAIRNSKIHDNWMGFYTAGGYNIRIDGSEFYGNTKYAIDPHTGTHNMTVSNNKIYNNQGIAVICSLQCYDIIYEGNEVHDNAGAGLMFSRATHDSTIRNNTIYNQRESATGIAISESQNNKIYGNTIRDSTFAISVHNPVLSPDDGKSTGNMVYDNTFDNVQNGIRAIASSSNTFSSNHFRNVTDYHYIMTSGASMDLQQQTFSGVNIRGDLGSNTLSIRDSGPIIVDNSQRYNTDEQPYTQVLSGQKIRVDSERT
ncbi:MAG: right-handed parallel beta-helix repeat-containing protein [Thermoproteota archaeon]|nr:right-handed parallel beta-helix repeat-containing protein [Thermoproteota archaeon]